ncbi:alpha/beta hydrolase [Ramlibacter sp. AN1015]|uniref:alpha/beta hydrolase n=1 Tax=Ramlibacter sp. AN1015 TaxID=3133428 RepID=UPI0030C44BC8
MTGIELEPQTAAMLARAAAMGVRPIESLSVQDARSELAALARLRPAPAGACDVRDLLVPVGDGASITARLYLPADAPVPSPVTVYFHGGGHVIGSIDTHDDVARRTALASHAALVSVGYRLAPEARFPVAVEDAWAALRWVAHNAADLGLDASRIAVMGDSAGANLATVTALRARDDAGPHIALQVLVYPLVDYRLQAASFDRYASGYGVLSAQAMRWFRSHYLRTSDDAGDWHASPVLAPRIAGSPPALVVAAQCDPLIDDIRLYVERLRAGGVPVEYVEYAGTVHGFFANPHALDAARDANERVADRLRNAFRVHLTGGRDGSRQG